MFGSNTAHTDPYRSRIWYCTLWYHRNGYISLSICVPIQTFSAARNWKNPMMLRAGSELSSAGGTPPLENSHAQAMAGQYLRVGVATSYQRSPGNPRGTALKRRGTRCIGMYWVHFAQLDQWISDSRILSIYIYYIRSACSMQTKLWRDWLMICIIDYNYTAWQYVQNNCYIDIIRHIRLHVYISER